MQPIGGTPGSPGYGRIQGQAGNVGQPALMGTFISRAQADRHREAPVHPRDDA
jgi:hypothetical protein